MENILINLRKDIQKFAETISQIIQMDVEIMDKNFIRVGGTGRLKNKVGQSMTEESHIYKKVLETGKEYVILNPKEDIHCSRCPSIQNCKEKLEVSTPIFFNNEVAGVIGLICFNNQQKLNFIDKQEKYLNFLKQISGFISSQAYLFLENSYAESKKEFLKVILNKIEEGILIYDNNHLLTHMNEVSIKLFNTKILQENLFIQPLNDNFLGKNAYSIIYNDKKLDVFGEIFTFSPFEKVLIFKEKKAIHNSILHVTNSTTGTLVKDFIFYSDSMKKLFERINKISKNPSTVLITGESGTGKEIIARTIHMNSNRVNQPFIAINCGAIPEALLESEFFGYVKGSFTGADPRGKIGKFELANGGTLFLDEIGDMPLYMQIKLLRVLQERKIIRIGSNQLIDVDVRIIAATNQNLEHLVEMGEFRKDLYYRLNVVPIEVPPLRKRTGDIFIFAEHFAEKYATLFKKNFANISSEVLSIFEKYNWPGNVRELENTIEYMINLMGDNGILSYNHLPQKLLTTNSAKIPQERTLKSMEIEMISNLLIKYGDSTESKKQIAKILGIGIATLYRKIEQYNLKH
ncbi:sigma-54-dependent Fis family transcriptional regulator [Cetobacterium sp. 2G large]|uniref:sigma-54 interaction domain-containing protein n=2 Tax=Cetobacterium TaxID=180162 RepID=UPI00163D1445|nr:sigma 54-interacting transcriptional regulator [Cetobacterium sp. 2G large]MBC2854748.1 sigma 54-interacting transcriptional regulator [Cetobacterium sp. 2G large]